MSRYDPDSVEARINDMLEITEEDMDLIKHVFEDEPKPPQGLHQRGYGLRRATTDDSDNEPPDLVVEDDFEI